MTEKPSIVMSLTVVTEDEAEAVKAWEVLGRAAVGLALDGVSVNTNIGIVTDEEDE